MTGYNLVKEGYLFFDSVKALSIFSWNSAKLA